MARLSIRKHVQGGFWRSLEAVGVRDAHARWGQRPRLVQRAVPPLVIAAVVLVLAWARGVPPHPALLLLLAVTYVLYLLPPRIRRIALPATVLGLALIYPILWANELDGQNFLFEIPVFKSFPSMDTMVVIAIFAMMAVGLNIVVGYAGLLDLGYVAFYALGAYAGAWFASPHASQFGIDFTFGGVGVPAGLGGFHISIWLVVIIAAAIAAAGGVVIGLPTLRLRGDYLAIVTLGFGEIIGQVARNGDETGFGFNLTNGPPGINPIDPPGFGSWLASSTGLPANFIVESGKYVNFVSLFYWSALALLLITVFCSIRLRDSRLGRAWIAIREDETAAAAMGIPLMRTKTWAYAIGAFFGGVAGAFYASFKGGAFPADFYFNISVFLLCMVILGGVGSVWGVLLGGMILGYLNVEGLATIGSKIQQSGIPKLDGFDPTKYQFGIYGIIIVAMMLLRPTGLIPERRHRIEMAEGVHDTPFYDVQLEGTLTDRDPSDD